MLSTNPSWGSGSKKTCWVLWPGAASPLGTRDHESPSMLATGITARLHSLVISVFRGGESLTFQGKVLFEETVQGDANRQIRAHPARVYIQKKRMDLPIMWSLPIQLIEVKLGCENFRY
jgi:hypothetical protein